MNNCKQELSSRGRGIHFYQCTKNAVRDGFCKIHHPEYVKEKDRLLREKWEEERKIRYAKLDLQDAAPQLLEALKMAMKFFPNPSTERNFSVKAIAKAEGRKYAKDHE